MTFQQFTYVSGADPLFVHQYSHAWVDFRGQAANGEPPDSHRLVPEFGHRDARAQGVLSEPRRRSFPATRDNVWGITASDSRKGYVAWGGPPRSPAIDGSVVPSAAAGSLMFTPEISVPALREMRRRFGDRIYGRYGFADAFHPTTAG